MKQVESWWTADGTIEAVDLVDVMPLLRTLEKMEAYVGDAAQSMAEKALEPFREILERKKARP